MGSGAGDYALVVVEYYEEAVLLFFVLKHIVLLVLVYLYGVPKPLAYLCADYAK